MTLGLAFSHNATTCIVESDCSRIRFCCCAKERFSRRKSNWGVPCRVMSAAQAAE